jgi:exodeoxyribonuclease V alpha subunit
MSPPGLGEALAEALPRLCAPAGPSGLDPLLLDVIRSLAAGLERGLLELDFSASAPEDLNPELWPEAYRRALMHSPLVVGAEALQEAPEAPLVLIGDQLRWRRWHQQLEQVLAELLERAQDPLTAPPSSRELDAARRQAAEAGLDTTQQQAVVAALSHRLLLLSGGPGTGKTTTVVAVLAALLRRDPALRFQLAAPTGKAAARLREAIERGSGQLPQALGEVLLAAPCSTLHRLLESSGERFGRHAGQPLTLDLLVVDEVSMVDLPLMAALLEALPRASRLVLVGDPGQLPPVGPGAVLLELMRPDRLTPLGDAAVELGSTYRNAGAIAAVAARLRGGGPSPLPAIRSQLEALSDTDNLHWRQAPADQAPVEAIDILRRHQRRLEALAEALPLGAGSEELLAQTAPLLAELDRCVLLTPTHQGRWGVGGIHRQLLGDAAVRPPAHWPAGTPVLNRRNLPELGLANGDVGVLLGGGQPRRVLFAGGLLLHTARLGPLEPALALTVHKSQGSQYGTVLLLLPPGRDWEPRLVYTGLTRAREQAWLFTPAASPTRADTHHSGGASLGLV